MIESKADYYYYLSMDEIARWGHKASFMEKIKLGNMWRFQKLLRKQEYNLNCRRGLIKKVINYYYVFKKIKLTERLGWDIPPNVFGPGLCIVHIGPVIVNRDAKVGANCRVQAMVNIGANGGDGKAPNMGDNLYIGPGAKIFGAIRVGNNVSIGANAVVNKSFMDDDIVIAGIPARVVRKKCEV